MPHFLLFYKNYLGKLFILLVISCIASGCNSGKETVPVSQPVVKKEAVSRSEEKESQNNSKTETKTTSAAFVSKQNKIPDATVKRAASGTILTENKNPANAIDASGKIRRFETAERDPFALPEELREQLPSSKERQNIARQIQQGYPQSSSAGNRSVYGYGISSERNVLQGTAGWPRSVLPYSPEPCVAGIFNNGKEKFALVRWQQIQGIFHTGEALGNGYYVKEITADSVFLCPEQNSSDSGTLTLTLQ